MEDLEGNNNDFTTEKYAQDSDLIHFDNPPRLNGRFAVHHLARHGEPLHRRAGRCMMKSIFYTLGGIVFLGLLFTIMLTWVNEDSIHELWHDNLNIKLKSYAEERDIKGLKKMDDTILERLVAIEDNLGLPHEIPKDEEEKPEEGTEEVKAVIILLQEDTPQAPEEIIQEEQVEELPQEEFIETPEEKI